MALTNKRQTYRDETGIGSDRGFELFHVDQTTLVDGKVGNLEAFILQHTTRIQDTFVLRLQSDDVLLA